MGAEKLKCKRGLKRTQGPHRRSHDPDTIAGYAARFRRGLEDAAKTSTRSRSRGESPARPADDARMHDGNTRTNTYVGRSEFGPVGVRSLHHERRFVDDARSGFDAERAHYRFGVEPRLARAFRGNLGFRSADIVLCEQHLAGQITRLDPIGIDPDQFRVGFGVQKRIAYCATQSAGSEYDDALHGHEVGGESVPVGIGSNG